MQCSSLMLLFAIIEWNQRGCSFVAPPLCFFYVLVDFVGGFFWLVDFVGILLGLMGGKWEAVRCPDLDVLRCVFGNLIVFL